MPEGVDEKLPILLSLTFVRPINATTLSKVQILDCCLFHKDTYHSVRANHEINTTSAALWVFVPKSPSTSQLHQSESAEVCISDSESDFDIDALPPMPPPPPPSLISLAQLVIKSFVNWTSGF